MMTVESGKEFGELLICLPNWFNVMIIKSVQLYKSSPQTESHVHLVLSGECFSQLKTVCSAENRLPKKAEEPYLCLCQIGEKWPGQCKPELFYSQPRHLPCPRLPVLKPAHLLCPTFLLAQNLSSKWTEPTDNVWPKLHDKYIHH